MKPQIITILDNIRSRENVGAIFRTADATGVSRIYLCGITPCPPHEKIVKTALGAEETVPWEYHKDTWRLLEALKKDGSYIVGLEKTEPSQNIFDAEFPAGQSIALVVGNEVDGLGESVQKRCDAILSIPMHGSKESLNVSVATGIAMYAIVNKVR